MNMKMPLWTVALPVGWLALVGASAAAEVAPGGKPNVIVILADDMGYADVGFNGCKDILTPHIDSIARNGVRCTTAYVSHSFCSPSRAGLLAGRYQQRFGHENNPNYDPNDVVSGLPTSEVLLPAVLKTAGYATGIVGKWHLGAAERFHPLNRGFDEFFGFLGGGHQYLPEKLGGDAEYTTDPVRNREPVKETEYLTDAFSREAVAFIDRRHDRPFFLYLAYNAPHTPLQAPAKYLDRFPNITDKRRRTYAAMVSALDDGVGRVLEAVRAHHLEEKTLIVFLSDNGGPLGDSGNASSNLPFRAGKGTIYDGGVRVPFAIQWKGSLPAGVFYDQTVSSLDIFATAAALAGAAPPAGADHALDGVNLIPYLRGERPDPPHETLYWRMGGGRSFAVRHRDQKLDEPAGGRPELYDLPGDVAESNDLAAARPKDLQRLARLKEQWNGELVPPAFAPRRPPAAKKKAAPRP